MIFKAKLTNALTKSITEKVDNLIVVRMQAERSSGDFRV
jgi:hypothetical protein